MIFYYSYGILLSWLVIKFDVHIKPHITPTKQTPTKHRPTDDPINSESQQQGRKSPLIGRVT